MKKDEENTADPSLPTNSSIPGPFVGKLPFLQHLDLLAGSLVLDSVFATKFLEDRGAAIEWYNHEFAPLYNQRPLELSDAELRLVKALRASTVEEFISLLAVITSGADPSIAPLSGSGSKTGGGGQSRQLPRGAGEEAEAGPPSRAPFMF